MRTRGKRGLHVLVFLAVCAALTAAVMLLWNALIPAIVGWGVINYWQALGLLVLCRLLLGGFGNMNKFCRQPSGGPGPFRDASPRFQEMRRKMCNMSKDERREFIRRRMADFDGHEEKPNVD